MDNLTLKGTWDVVKGILKQKYAQLTDDDLKFAEGEEDKLYGRLEQRLGKTRDEVKREIRQAIDRLL